MNNKDTEWGGEIRVQVIQILNKISPEMEAKMEEAVDIVHRMEMDRWIKKMDNKNKNVIILFAHRQIKEKIWHQRKGSPICKEMGICFVEMLPPEECEERRRLRPQTEEESWAGKLTFFWGLTGNIKGQPIGMYKWNHTSLTVKTILKEQQSCTFHPVTQSFDWTVATLVVHTFFLHLSVHDWC